MTQATKKEMGFAEFVTLMALLTSLIALSIDAMLPALDRIGLDLGVTDLNDTQLVIGMVFFGMAVGQIFYGPLSDSIGRKPAIYLGLLVFMGGSVISLVAQDFETMLLGRLLQGLGASGPKVVTIAMIRDCHEGRAMARIMSFIMAVFILVPALAPSLGQGVLYVFGDWRSIFWSFLVLAGIGIIWFAFRQPETLTAENKVPLQISRIWEGIRIVCTHPITLGYMVAAGLVFGAFIGYLSTAQQIFQGIYDTGEHFAFYFGALAISIGAASVLNARLVMRLGMRFLSQKALQVMVATALTFLVAVVAFEGQPPLWSFMVYGAVTFFSLGLLFGNFNALAMEPMGHHAGIAASVIGSFSTFIAMALGVAIGQTFNGTLYPLVLGFAVLGLASLVVMSVTERYSDKPAIS
ncbi:multidrug effflux MFS transporter [Rhodovibrionaceae bacterium A322]